MTLNDFVLFPSNRYKMLVKRLPKDVQRRNIGDKSSIMPPMEMIELVLTKGRKAMISNNLSLICLSLVSKTE